MFYLIILFFFCKDELNEIAERTKIPIPTVKKYYNDYMVYKLLNIFFQNKIIQ